MRPRSRTLEEGKRTDCSPSNVTPVGKKNRQNHHRRKLENMTGVVSASEDDLLLLRSLQY